MRAGRAPWPVEFYILVFSIYRTVLKFINLRQRFTFTKLLGLNKTLDQAHQLFKILLVGFIEFV